MTSNSLGGLVQMRLRCRLSPRGVRGCVLRWSGLIAMAACEGDPHASTGRYDLAFTGGLTGRVSGVVTAQYHASLGVDPSFTIALPFPSGTALFPSDNPGALGFVLDSLPTPGTYAAVPVEIARWRGERRARQVVVVLGSASGAEDWDPRGGTVVVTAEPGVRDGLRARFVLQLIRTQSIARRRSVDTATVMGTIETR